MANSIKNLIAAVLIAISGYLTWTQVVPKYSAVAYYKEKIEERNIILGVKMEILNKIESLRNENNEKYTELQRLALVLPEKKGLPEVISSMEEIHLRSGVILPEITIGESYGNERVGQVTLSTNSESTYGQILTVLGYLEKNLRLYDIRSIEMVLKDDKQNGPDPRLIIKIEGHAYWLKPSVREKSSVLPKNESE